MTTPYSETYNFDALLSTTLSNYRNKLTDNIFNKVPLFYWLNQKGRKRTEDGGTDIVEQLLYGKNTLTTYSGYDVLNTQAVDGITIAKYPWKQFQVPITISRIEERKNSGKARLLNLLEAKVKQSEKTMRDGLNTQAFADGTANGGLNLTGLDAMVLATGTYGGIAKGTYSWWQSYVSDSAVALTYDAMQTAYLTCADGQDAPDLILTTQTLYQKYWSLLQPQQRYTDPKTLDAGFQNLTFNGATMMMDKACTSTNMYFLNSEYLAFVVDKNTDMLTTDFRVPTDQDAKVAHILLYANLTASNCARQGVLKSRTA